MATAFNKRVAAVVFNSVNHDTRVLKEADSLARAGYEITVFGIRDSNCKDAQTLRDSGARIQRVDWMIQARTVFFGPIFGLILFALLFAIVVALVYDEAVPKSTVISGGVIAILLGGVPLYLRANRRHRALAGLEGPAAGETAIDSSLRQQAMPSKTRGIISRCCDLLIRAIAPVKANPVVIELRYILKRLISMVCMSIAASKAVKAYRPEIVHCHDLNTVPVGYGYSKRAKCKLVYDSHEIYEEQSSFGRMTGFVYRLMQRFYSSRIDGFITINDSIRDFLESRYPALPKAVIIKNATVPLEGEIVYDGRLHKVAGLAPDTKILLYQGGFSRRRGLDMLVRSAVLLPDCWCLVMMGWGSQEPALRQLAQAIDQDGRHIRFVARVPHDELAYWTAGAAIGVIPYEKVGLNNWFCTPNKLWEYPNAGVPVLVSPFPEMTKVVHEYGIGWLLQQPLSPENIAGHIASITDEDLKETRAAARAFIQNDNWLVYERRLLDLYKSMAAS
ncbi:MAG: glycosyltransferase [Gammaproteobacteria bacterium]